MLLLLEASESKVLAFQCKAVNTNQKFNESMLQRGKSNQLLQLLLTNCTGPENGF